MTPALHRAAARNPPRNTASEFCGHEQPQRGCPHHADDAAPAQESPSTCRARRPPQRAPDRQCGTDQHGLGAGVAGVEAARRVTAGMGEDRHPQRGRPCAGDGHGEQRPQAATARPGIIGPDAAPQAPRSAPGQNGQHHDGPHQVELLFDGQGPGVEQRRGPARRQEVIGVVRDEVPVGDIEDRRHRVAAQRRAVEDPRPQRGPGAHGGEHQEQGREQTPGPARPKVPEADRVALSPLGQEERGDEVARQREEDVDAEKAPGDRGHGVGGDDRHHRHPSNAVQSRQVLDRDPRRGTRRRSHGTLRHPPGGRPRRPHPSCESPCSSARASRTLPCVVASSFEDSSFEDSSFEDLE